MIGFSKNLLALMLLLATFLFVGCTTVPPESTTILGLDTFTGMEIINNSFVIYLDYFPLATIEGRLIVRKNNVVLVSGVDYVVPTTEVDPITGYARVIPETRLPFFINTREDLSDGYYTGTIKFLDNTLFPTDEVTVTYNYMKPTVCTYSISGTGSRGPYYIANHPKIVPGEQVVTVWNTGSSNETIYTGNTSFEPDMGATGYSFGYYQPNPYIMFNTALDTNKRFSISYRSVN
ncbi:MAG: hypothetical protein NT099_03970 [Candidatus Saganbacteria bacterium]|nr:hypothetical protein [Candidatus Saganbacteria bacterium]